MKNFKLKNNKGFTLIEMMVAIGLFTIIVVMGIASILSVNKVYNKNSDQRQILDTLTFAMEDIARNISVGSAINCKISDPSSGPDANGNYLNATLYSVVDNAGCSNISAISFLPFTATLADDARTSYAFIGGNNACNNGKRLYKSTDNGSTFTPITGPEICLDAVKSGFLVTGADPSDLVQPRVTIRLSGYVMYHSIKSTFNLQTSVSQRLIDAP